ncbi:MAG: LysM peptidoglycan-binding domain-containing protein, partial [Actinocrinis sp.]
VEPPGGRHHDSLWDIAQRYLGDGRRYREIFTLNEGRLQPDGTQLQHASLIRPGWVLVLPADAQGPGLSEQPPSNSTASAPVTQAPAKAAPSRPAPSAHASGTSGTNGSGPSKNTVNDSLNGGAGNAVSAGSAGSAANGASAGHGAPPPSSSIPHPVASRPAVPHDEPAGEHGADGSVLHSIADVLPYVALIGSPILAAALLAALTAAARRRRRDHPDAPIAAAPDPAIAEVERTIRAAASDDAVELVDRALRALREACENEGRVPPAVRHARVDADALHLALEVPEAPAPAPWIAAVDGSHWKFDRGVPAPDWAPEHRPAVPFPLMLPIGALGDDQILVNLEASAGRCTAVTGPNRQRRAVLAAAAATLACAPWADQIRIEAVGLPSELALLAPERLRLHPDLPAALAALEHEAAATGPHLVRLLIADAVGAQDTGRLRVLTAGADGSTAALVGTEHPWPDFTVFSVDPVGRLRLPEVPGELSAARLPDALASALGALFRTAAAPRYALPR